MAAPAIRTCYVGSGRKVYVRKEAAPAPLVASESYPGSSYVVGIAIDPANPQTAFVIDASNVYLTKDAGATWTKITGNLMTFDPVVLRSIAYATDVNLRLLVCRHECWRLRRCGAGLFQLEQAWIGTSKRAGLPNGVQCRRSDPRRRNTWARRLDAALQEAP
jgi:hypothetical protein